MIYVPVYLFHHILKAGFSFCFFSFLFFLLLIKVSYAGGGVGWVVPAGCE